jgi:hypothetical protein
MFSSGRGFGSLQAFALNFAPDISSAIEMSSSDETSFTEYL